MKYFDQWSIAKSIGTHPRDVKSYDYHTYLTLVLFCTILHTSAKIPKEKDEYCALSQNGVQEYNTIFESRAENRLQSKLCIHPRKQTIMYVGIPREYTACKFCYGRKVASLLLVARFAFAVFSLAGYSRVCLALFLDDGVCTEQSILLKINCPAYLFVRSFSRE